MAEWENDPVAIQDWQSDPPVESWKSDPPVDDSLQVLPESFVAPARSSEELAMRTFQGEQKALGTIPTRRHEDVWETLTTPLKEIAHKLTGKTVADAFDVVAAYVSQNETLREQLAEPSRQPGTTEKIIAGTQSGVAEAVNAFTSPLGIATLGVGALPKTAQTAVSGLFAAHMASALPEQTKLAVEAIKAGDQEAAAQHITGGALTATFAGIAGKHFVTGTKQILVQRAKDVGPATEQAFKETVKEPTPAGTAPEPMVPLETATSETVKPAEVAQPTSSEPSLPISSSKVEVPQATTPSQGVKKAQAEVRRVAEVENPSDAKVVKKTLVAEIEDLLKKPESAEKVTIEIPGDGTFTVVNTRANLEELLKRAKRIETNAGKVPVTTRGISREDKAEVDRLLKEGSGVTGLANEKSPTYGPAPKEPAVEARGSARKIFDFNDQELSDFFERAPAVEKLGRSKYPFANYNEFKDWMAARYGERDLDGMKEAFASVGAPFKVQYVKEHRTGSDHLKAWIGHMATGSPLPSVDPPKPRTTPRPMPGAWQAPPPGGTGQRPSGGGPSAGATPPGTPPPQPPPPRPPPPGAMPTAPFGVVPKEPVRASEIIKDLSDVMERPIRFGHIAQGKSTIGIFKTKLEVARIRRANDIPTAAHETAHMLERIHRKVLGGVSRNRWYQSMPADVFNELKGLDYDPMQQRAYEGFAEFVRHWITEGDTAQITPRTHAWFESTFLNQNPSLANGLRSIRDKGMAFRNQGAVKRVESMVQFDPPKEPFKERLARKLRDAHRLWVDDLSSLERVEKEIVGGEKLALGAASPTKIARTVTQSSGARATEWAKHGMTDFAGNRTGPGLKEIFKGVAGDEKNAILYAVARRAQELHRRGIDPGITREDANYAVQALHNPAREQLATQVSDWNRGALEYLLKAGGIKQETFDTITAQNDAYIPFFRVWEQESAASFPSGGRRIGDAPQAVKRIKGSGREILNPIETMQQHANQIIATADKVRVAKSLVELVETREGFGKYVEQIPADKIPVEFDLNRIKKQIEDAGGDLSRADLDAIMTLFVNSPRTPTGGNIVAFVKNGQRKFYELDPELYRSLQALDYYKVHPVLDAVAGKFARSVRLGATGIRAGFTLFTNPVRDFATMLLQSQGNPISAAGQWFKHMAKQVGMRDNEIKNLWRATGGELSQPLGLDRKAIRKSVDDVLNNTAKQKAWNVLKHPVETARAALSFTEAAPRIAEFEMTLRQMGWQPGQRVTPDMAIEAALKAAEVTVNFRRAGAYGRAVNQLIAFWNPAIQGLSKFNRSHMESKIGSVSRGVALVTIPALLNWWANKDDEEWQQFPDWIKYGFLNFKIGGEWVKLPTPFEWWWVYGALPMASAESIYQKNPDEMAKMMEQAIKQMVPPVIPSVAVPPIEAIANKSFHTGKPIISETMQRLAPQEQAHPHTSTTARKVSEILSVGGVEVSPAKIEHVLNGETGGFWGDVIGTAERFTGTAPPREMLEPADIPILGRIFVRDNASSVIDEFYTQYEHLEAKKATHKKLSDEGESERAAKYELEGSETARLRYMSKIAKRMSELRKHYKAATTREDRDALWKEMVELANSALEQ